MTPLDLNVLHQAAVSHGIRYSALQSSFANGIRTEMARIYNLPKSELFKKIANLKDHTRLFSHLTAINVVDSAAVANVIGPNQFVIVEGLAEGGSKLGVKLVTLTPDDEISCELVTDLFDSAISKMPDGTLRPLDKKKGVIKWKFVPVSPTQTEMHIESDFEIGPASAYIRGAVDHVWLDFFENVMIDTGELLAPQKIAKPF